MSVEPLAKPVHSLVLDAGPLIKGEPSISSLLQQCEELICSPAVISEIRDQATRARVETSLKPFLHLRTPKPESTQVIANFAKRTGDYAVLSKTDTQLLALAYELECERNGGDWRLRSIPGQKRINGSAPISKISEASTEESETTEEKPVESMDPVAEALADLEAKAGPMTSSPQSAEVLIGTTDVISTSVKQMSITDDAKFEALGANNDHDQSELLAEDEEEDEDDEAGQWITPNNIKRKQLEENKAAASGTEEPKVMQVAMITTDFAMQNVLLQMNLNLLSPSLQRVRHIKTFVLRCHACFTTVRDMTKQFCPRCGGDTLTRVTCSTNHKGEFQLHLKKNFQWNNRGAKYSIPKPVHGASNQRVKGGGKGGWGNDLILSEDQKEYVRAVDSSKREKRRDLMDEDYLPSILSGNRSGQGSSIKVGAGKHVNSRKR